MTNEIRIDYELLLRAQATVPRPRSLHALKLMHLLGPCRGGTKQEC